MPLTDAAIRQAKPRDKAYRLTDAAGLVLNVSKTGRKTFVVQVRDKGKQRAITLGDYPDVRLPDARRRRDEIRADVSAAVETAREEKAARPQPSIAKPRSDLWSEAAARYVAFRHRQGMHPRTAPKLERHVGATVDALGNLRVGQITPADVLEAVRPFEEAGKIETAHEVRARCAQIFDFCAGEGIVNSNPARVVVKAMIQRRPGKFPGFTEPKAIGRLLRTIHSFDRCEPQIRTALILSAYLFPRNDMLRGMTWDEVDLHSAIWEVPAHRMKGEQGRAQDFLVPLPRQAIRHLVEIKQWTGRTPYVIPAPRDPLRKVSDATFNSALRRMGYCTKTQHCHHGFRTTASTTLNELGFNRDWIERQLAHVDDDTVRRGYNKAQYLEGRTRMMQEYADWLDAQMAEA